MTLWLFRFFFFFLCFSTLVVAGNIGWSASASALNLRSLALESTAALRSQAATDAEVWKHTSRLVFDSAGGVGTVMDRWFSPTIEMTITKPDALRYATTWNLWDASNVLVADVSSVIEKSTNASFASSYRSDVEWRFCQDNILTKVIPPTLELANLIELKAYDAETTCTCATNFSGAALLYEAHCREWA